MGKKIVIFVVINLKNLFSGDKEIIHNILNDKNYYKILQNTQSHDKKIKTPKD